MDQLKTLCQNCQEGCKTYEYKNITRRGNLIQFQYCNGNYELIRQHTYTISRTNNRINIQVGYGEQQGRLITGLMKKNLKNDVIFLDKNRTNLQLNNLQERPRSCTIQEQEGQTSIYPGVTRLNDGRYSSFIKIDGKTTFLGYYTKELDAYHHYLLKCEEIGRKINKTTKAYKNYEKEFDITKFRIYKLKKKNKYKNISYDKSTGFYRLKITRKGKQIANENFKNINDAVKKRNEILKKYNEKKFH